MKHYGKQIGMVLGILTAGILLGFVLIVGAYALPTAPMRRHVEDSVDILMEEGAYPVLYGERDIRMNPRNFTDVKVFFLNNRGTARDNITDATMLNIAVFDQGGNVVSKAMRNSFAQYDMDNKVAELWEYAAEKNTAYEAEEYSRYWHGYLVILKPLLMIFTYGQIRWLNVGALLFLLGWLICLLYRKGEIKELFLFLYALLFLVPVVIPFCMQYCTVSYIALGGMILVVRGEKNLSSKNSGGGISGCGHGNQLYRFSDIPAFRIRPAFDIYAKSYPCAVLP